MIATVIICHSLTALVGAAAVQHRIYDNVAGAPLRASYAMLPAMMAC